LTSFLALLLVRKKQWILPLPSCFFVFLSFCLPVFFCAVTNLMADDLACWHLDVGCWMMAETRDY
jgi:hypothetical protein